MLRSGSHTGRAWTGTPASIKLPQPSAIRRVQRVQVDYQGPVTGTYEDAATRPPSGRRSCPDLALRRQHRPADPRKRPGRTRHSWRLSQSSSHCTYSPSSGPVFMRVRNPPRWRSFGKSRIVLWIRTVRAEPWYKSPGRIRFTDDSDARSVPCVRLEGVKLNGPSTKAPGLDPIKRQVRGPEYGVGGLDGQGDPGRQPGRWGSTRRHFVGQDHPGPMAQVSDARWPDTLNAPQPNRSRKTSDPPAGRRMRPSVIERGVQRPPAALIPGSRPRSFSWVSPPESAATVASAHRASSPTLQGLAASWTLATAALKPSQATNFNSLWKYAQYAGSAAKSHR